MAYFKRPKIYTSLRTAYLNLDHLTVPDINNLND